MSPVIDSWEYFPCYHVQYSYYVGLSTQGDGYVQSYHYLNLWIVWTLLVWLDVSIYKWWTLDVAVLLYFVLYWYHLLVCGIVAV